MLLLTSTLTNQKQLLLQSRNLDFFLEDSIISIMDYYQTLGVNKNASQEDIKKAYRKLASQHHPDKGGDKAKFQAIQEAYATLSDDQKRAEYDNPHQPFHFGGGGFGGFENFHEDIFSQMFGGSGVHFGNGFHRQQPRRNRNVNIVVQLTLKEILTGKDVVGSIKLPSGQDQAIQIRIPPGVESGDSIKYPGLGDNSIQGMPQGDLIAQIREIPDPRFHRQGVNLIVDHAISSFDAILGTKIKVSTLDDKIIEVTVPEGTGPDTVLSCAGHGLPFKNSTQRGHLFIKITVTTPTNLTASDKIILEGLRQKYSV